MERFAGKDKELIPETGNQCRNTKRGNMSSLSTCLSRRRNTDQGMLINFLD